MASNKDQHFVPKCYLRSFSSDPLGAAINLYNIDRGKVVTTAPIKSQCSKDYFYGKNDQLEQAIQTLEGQYASTLRSVQGSGHRMTDGDRYVLGIFWLFQHLRTEEASKQSVGVAEGIRDVVGADDLPSLEIKDAVQVAMQTFASNMRAVTDLRVCLLRNRTQVPFITSGNPAVLTNRWYLEDPRARGMSFGLGASGALFLLPLSPTIFCLGYDGDVYSIPHNGGWADVRREADVGALNEHQFLNCCANIYFRDPAAAEMVRDGFCRAMPCRPRARHEVHYAVKESSEDGYERYVEVDPVDKGEHSEALVHTRKIHARPSRWPALLRWRSTGRVYTNGTGVGYLREVHAADHSGSGPGFWRDRARRR